MDYMMRQCCVCGKSIEVVNDPNEHPDTKWCCANEECRDKMITEMDEFIAEQKTKGEKNDDETKEKTKG